MFRILRLPFSFLRRHPGVVVLSAFLLCVAGVFLANRWARDHYRSAEQALKNDRLDQARYHVAECLRVWRYGSQTHFLAARIEREGGDLRAAGEHLRECVRLQHGPSEATQLEQILIRAESGELDEVEAGLWKCIEANHPETSEILATLARVYVREGRQGAALACLDRLVEREPQSARAWHWRGWVNEQGQEYVRAILDYQRALELQPDRWGARLRLTGLLLERNNLHRSALHLQELQRDHADDIGVRTVLAKYHERSGEGEEAARLLDAVLQERPDFVEALVLRGQLAYQEQHLTECEAYLRRALRLRPSHSSALYTLYQCLEQRGDETEAARVYRRYKDVEVDARRLAALLNPRNGPLPEDPALLTEVGSLCLRLGEERRGVAWLHRALKADPNHKPAHEALARYYESVGDGTNAEPHRRWLAHSGGASPPAAQGGAARHP